MSNYPISSRDYLKRARTALADGKLESHFYAAWELRCGVESRMTEYLDAWEHITAKKKKGWRVADIARNLEATFKTGNKIVRWAISESAGANPWVIYYYTPVLPQLRKSAEQLGNYLHSMKKFRPVDDPWWDNFKAKLELTASDLEVANRGTMLGPPLMKTGTSGVMMNLEILPSLDPRPHAGKLVGTALVVNVGYLDTLPQPIEAEAQVWDGRS